MLRPLGLRSEILTGCACIGLAVAVPSEVVAQPNLTSQSAPETITYKIKRGENLYSLAEQHFNRTESWRVVQRLNAIVDPRFVPVGTRLIIPVAVLRAQPLTARVVAVRGTVHIRAEGRELDAKIGTELPQGTTIETGTDGFVSLDLPNGSRTSLPTLSRLSIVHLRKILLTQSIDYDFVVEAGKADTRVTPLGPGNGLFRIRTPRAVAAVRGTQFRVGFTKDLSLAEVLEGTVAAGAPGQPGEPVGKGFGAVIASGHVTREALLPAPALLSPGMVQVDPLVRLALEAVPGASGYHVQIARDASFVDVIAEARGTAPTFELPNIPNGGLFVRSSVFAGSGLEGLAETYAMRRALTGLAASAESDLDRVAFKWGGTGEGRRIYRFQLARGNPNNTPIIDEPGLEDDGISLRGLEPGTYYWRVGVRQFTGEMATENWVPFEKFTINTPRH